jgi:hypothetical protein
MKIFTTSYYKGLFVILNNNFAVKILEKDGRIVFGKLTTSFNDKPFYKQEAIKQFPVSEKYLDFIIGNYNKFKVIWNVNYENHKVGDLYDISKETYRGYPHNHVCHHISHYRRSGGRAINDSWKLAVAGLNTQLFNKLKQ